MLLKWKIFQQKKLLRSTGNCKIPSSRSWISIVGQNWILINTLILVTSCHQDISQSWSKSSPPAELLLKQVDSAAIPLQNFRGSASIETFVSGIKSRASLRIRYLNPRQYRIDNDGPLFQVLAIILVNN